MYKIFFDTNSIFEEGKARSIREVFNSKIEDLINFLKTNGRLDDIEICIPKIVIEERLKHVSEKGEEKVE